MVGTGENGGLLKGGKDVVAGGMLTRETMEKIRENELEVFVWYFDFFIPYSLQTSSPFNFRLKGGEN